MKNNSVEFHFPIWKINFHSHFPCMRCHSYGYYCCDETEWPKETWGGKGLLERNQEDLKPSPSTLNQQKLRDRRLKNILSGLTITTLNAF